MGKCPVWELVSTEIACIEPNLKLPYVAELWACVTRAGSKNLPWAFVVSAFKLTGMTFRTTFGLGLPDDPGGSGLDQPWWTTLTLNEQPP